MDLATIAQGIESSGLADWLRGSLKAIPIINAIHVMALTTVFGTILIIDLRLLGVPNTRRPYTRVAGELLRWTGAAFAVAVITGALMFTPNATTYVGNTAFWLKMCVILLAGLNMLVFQFIIFPSVASWDKNTLPPLAARLSGGLSLLLWAGVIVLGRVIGFTKGFDFEVPEDVDLDFDFLEGVWLLLPAAARRTSARRSRSARR